MSLSKKSLPSLVDANWLAENINQPDIVILDSSWHMPQENRDGAAEWLEERIPGSQFFDFDRRICAKDAELPHMMPDVETFNDEVRRLGVKQDSRIVVYDVLGVFSAARAWWMFRAMGHDNVTLLNGGLPAWKRAGQATASGEEVLPEAGDFSGVLQAHWVADAGQVQAALADPEHAVLDARSGERFAGVASEPRAGLRGGHMPGALSLPTTDLHDTQGALQSPAELKEAFADLGLQQDQSLTFSCGSGVTACVVALAAELSGYNKLSVYDGSWTEWGSPESDLPVVTGWD